MLFDVMHKNAIFGQSVEVRQHLLVAAVLRATYDYRKVQMIHLQN